VSKERLQEEFTEYARSLVRKEKKSLEEVLEATLDITTPTQPGDLRTTRKWQEGDDESESQWL